MCASDMVGKKNNLDLNSYLLKPERANKCSTCSSHHSCTTGWFWASLIIQPGSLDGVCQHACGKRIYVRCTEHGCGAAYPQLLPFETRVVSTVVPDYLTYHYDNFNIVFLSMCLNLITHFKLSSNEKNYYHKMTH